jgi:tetratricopeptide (TPR) repeat protein
VPRRPPLSYRLREAANGLGRRLAAFGAWLVSPIEWLFHFIGRKFFALSERLNDVDSVLLALVAVVTWPLRMLWRLIAAIGSALFPQSVRRGVEAPVAKVGEMSHRAGAGIGGLLEKLNLDGLVMWIVWLTQPIWRPIAAVGGFVYAWLATRRYRGLLWGIPAAVLLLPIIAAAAWGLLWGRGAAAERYKIAVREAREAKDYASMRLFERKLGQLGVDTQSTDYKTARALAEEGKLDEAYERMQRLAPEDVAGFPPAHAWILQQMLAKTLTASDEERLRVADVHLNHLKQLRIRGPEIDFLRAIWLAQSQRLPEASDAMAPLVSRMPPAAMERLRIDLLLGRMDDARNDARAVRNHMEDAKRQKKALDAQQYQAWAVAEELLGDVDRLGPVVREWREAAPKDLAARRGVAMLDVRQFNDMLQSPNAKPEELAKRLVELTRLVERSEYQPQLVALYAKRKSLPVIQQVMDAVTALPDTPAAVIEVIGTAAALDGDIVPARKLLKRVIEEQPNNAVAWNNYAWALSQEPSKDLELALAAVNHALALAPNEFRFRETRGQINLALGQWSEAAEDLEFALNGMPDAAVIHVSLAKAYEALGQKELADMHRNQVQ